MQLKAPSFRGRFFLLYNKSKPRYFLKDAVTISVERGPTAIAFYGNSRRRHTKKISINEILLFGRLIQQIKHEGYHPSRVISP